MFLFPVIVNLYTFLSAQCCPLALCCGSKGKSHQGNRFIFRSNEKNKDYSLPGPISVRTAKCSTKIQTPASRDLHDEDPTCVFTMLFNLTSGINADC